MNIKETAIKGVVVIETRLIYNGQDYFFESFSQKEFDEKVRPISFVQDNESMSSYGVIRGLHFQRPPYSQSKLIRCIEGEVLDVVVDIRKNSPTYGKYVSVKLTGENHHQLFIPRGFAHGFSVLSETALIQYKCDNFYAPESEGGINIKDASLQIDWSVPTENAILSERDLALPLLKDFESPFEFGVNYYEC
jgi:dTDP-4-dehydrorhamnose 3,5-epimerase